ncbi:probable aspartic protease At2g35615 [Telopea speciosissima]|uniref:probable aspartic protease At2g35615 n=1 Tax=Telopea speciosissima TaxID=54955 RepID=UPI001CC3D390|nr:probable aspartic protease At2g35615 [Telopea speciosissima]
MATAFSVYELFIFLSFTFFISLPCLSIDTAIPNPKHPRFAIDLIHRDSPLSPLYNSDTTFWDKAEKLYETSIARYAYLTSKRNDDKYRTFTFLDLDGFQYLAKLTIGTPTVDVFTILDTGSPLLWIQCKPCIYCERQFTPYYDRTKSTTYSNISCNSWDCGLVLDQGCDNHNVCVYHMKYADNSYSYGFLATEILSFRDSQGGVMATVKDVVFGCGLNNHNKVQGQFGGILGLAATQVSLVEQLAFITKPQFSYCLGNASEPASQGNLIIGEDAHISGFNTPFIVEDGFYKVNLVEIKVDSQSLDIPQGVFGPSKNVIIDTGTVYTFLPPEAHEKLAEAISQTMKRFKVKPIPPKREGELCYTGRIGKDVNGFPTMTISFLGNAKLVLERWSIFVQKEYTTFCLGFLPTSLFSTDDDLIKPSIIGSMAQQFYNFGFDLELYDLSIINSVCIY